MGGGGERGKGRGEICGGDMDSRDLFDKLNILQNILRTGFFTEEEGRDYKAEILLYLLKKTGKFPTKNKLTFICISIISLFI